METMSHQEFQLLLWKNAFNKGIPASDIFELTPLCNLDCRMCYVHLQDPSVSARMMNGDQWIAIMDEAIELGMLAAILTGGEAMTHPDFWKIYKHLTDRGISISVKTNGILLNRDAIERFSDVPPSTIDISIYGCDRESYQAVTGHDRFADVDANIRAALAAGLPLRFMITPSGYMRPWMDRILEYAKSFDIKTIVNTQLLDPHDNTGRHKEDFDLPADTIMEIRRRANALFSKHRLACEEEDTGEKPVREKTEEELEQLRCTAGRSHFAVTWDGKMLPCLTFPRDVISADVRTAGVKEAWNQVHEAVTAFRVPEQCRTCHVRSRCNYCPSSHGRYAKTRQCNPVVCELEQRIIEERWKGENA